MRGRGSRSGTSTVRRVILVVGILAAITVGGVLANYAGYFGQAPGQGGPSLMRADCSSVTNATSAQHVAYGGSGNNSYFLIVEADQGPYAGMNGSLNGFSQNASAPWPIMNVKLGQVVSIHVINCAPSESHGFQITYYDDISKNLISIQPGMSYDVTFTATKAGTFRVYCGIFCLIHPAMQNGELIVS